MRVERGRPFIGVAAAKQTIASLLDPSNTAQLEQRLASANTSVAASSKRNPRVAAGADAADAEQVLARLGSSSGDSERDRDPTDCMAILRSFQVRSQELFARRGSHTLTLRVCT